jgi:hypothetical protein
MKRFQPAMVAVTTFGAGAKDEFGSTRHSRSRSSESPGQDKCDTSYEYSNRLFVGESRDGCTEAK